MKHLSIAVSLVLLSACSMPLLALAQQESAPDGPLAPAMPGPPPGFGHGHGPGPGPGAQGLPPFLHGIDLSEAQQDKVFAATYAQAPLQREQEKIAFKAHAQLRELAAPARAVPNQPQESDREHQCLEFQQRGYPAERAQPPERQ